MGTSSLVSFLAAAAVGIASAQQQPMKCGPNVNVCGIMTLESGFGAGNYKVGGYYSCVQSPFPGFA